MRIRHMIAPSLMALTIALVMSSPANASPPTGNSNAVITAIDTSPPIGALINESKVKVAVPDAGLQVQVMVGNSAMNEAPTRMEAMVSEANNDAAMNVAEKADEVTLGGATKVYKVAGAYNMSLAVMRAIPEESGSFVLRL